MSKTNKYQRLGTNHMFSVWNHMMQRCYNPKRPDYRWYGARGITVSDGWHDFVKFVDDMLPTYRKGLELDRIDNGLGYSKSNCRWITHKEQCNNRNTNHIVIDPATGKQFNFQQLSELYHVPRPTINSRWLRGNRRFDQLIHKGHLTTYNFQKGY